MKIPEIIIVKSRHQAGSLAKILNVIAEENIVVEGLKATGRDYAFSTWEITIEPEEGFDFEALTKKIDDLTNCHVIGRSDRVFNRHKGGKLKYLSNIKINSDEVLRDVYTPGVARVCKAIAADVTKAREFTSLNKTVAIVTNGTAILGLGNIGPVAGLPVMEGKAALLAEFVELNGVPILTHESEVEKIAQAIITIAPSFGAIQLEDIKAPECFALEKILKEKLNIPVMHDDQHGTAVVTLAALISATENIGESLKELKVGQIGLGAAGLGIARLLIQYGVKEMWGTDLNENAKKQLVTIGGQSTNLEQLMKHCDVIIATTGVKGLIKPEWVQQGQIILALSNPEPEISVQDALKAGAKFAVDGRVVNNVLGFPGIFKGALDAGAKSITDKMLIAAAESISAQRPKGHLVPKALDPEMHTQVAAAVGNAV